MDKVIVVQDENLVRLDKYLVEHLPEYTRTQIQIMISNLEILVNDKEAKPSQKLKKEDVITIKFVEPKTLNINPEQIPLNIVYEDKDLIVVNKPKGMVVHPAFGNYEGTLVNALMHHCKDLSTINGVIRAGIVHRLDKDTSGLLVACKNDLSHKNLSKQFSDKTVTRKYVALVHGVINHNLGKIEAPIGRSKEDRKLMGIVEDGKEAITHFRVLERFKNNTLVELTLETGRTHQIRVHLKYIGHPVVGDPQYGLRKDKIESGQFLHAQTLGFVHPKTKKYLEFSSELPTYFNDFLSELKNNE